MTPIDKIKKYSAKKMLIPAIALGIILFGGINEVYGQKIPHVTNISANETKITCDLLFADFDKDGNIDEIKIAKAEKNNQIAVYLKKGDEQGNLINFSKSELINHPRSDLIINFNSQTYIKAIVNDFDNNGTQDIKFITQDNDGITQYNFYGNGKGTFTNNPKQTLALRSTRYKN